MLYFIGPLWKKYPNNLLNEIKRDWIFFTLVLVKVIKFNLK